MSTPAIKALKVHLGDRALTLYAECRTLDEERERLRQPHGGISDEDEDRERMRLLGLKAARLSGQADGIAEALAALDRFAVHSFTEDVV